MNRRRVSVGISALFIIFSSESPTNTETMSSDYQSEELLNGSPAPQKKETPPPPPDWERVKYRQLEKGERVAKGDWVDMCRDGWRDDPKWVPATKIGEAAPDPCYPSHRTFRRILG